MSTKTTIGMLIDIEDFEKLKQINKRLYELDDKPFRLDERRDLANLMFTILTRAYPVNDEDF